MAKKGTDYKGTKKALYTGKRAAGNNYNHLSRAMPETLLEDLHDGENRDAIYRGAISELLRNKGDYARTAFAAQLAQMSGQLDTPSIQRKINANYTEALKYAEGDEKNLVLIAMDKNDQMLRQSRKSNLAGKVASLIAVLLGGIGIAMFTPTLTGNVVGTSTPSNMIGSSMILVGLVGSYFFLKK